MDQRHCYAEYKIENWLIMYDKIKLSKLDPTSQIKQRT